MIRFIIRFIQHWLIFIHELAHVAAGVVCRAELTKIRIGYPSKYPVYKGELLEWYPNPWGGAVSYNELTSWQRTFICLAGPLVDYGILLFCLLHPCLLSLPIAVAAAMLCYESHRFRTSDLTLIFNTLCSVTCF